MLTRSERNFTKLSEATSTNTPSQKREARSKLQNDVEVFLKNGGKIEKLSNGFTEQKQNPGARAYNIYLNEKKKGG